MIDTEGSMFVDSRKLQPGDRLETGQRVTAVTVRNYDGYDTSHVTLDDGRVVNYPASNVRVWRDAEPVPHKARPAFVHPATDEGTDWRNRLNSRLIHAEGWSSTSADRLHRALGDADVSAVTFADGQIVAVRANDHR